MIKFSEVKDGICSRENIHLLIRAEEERRGIITAVAIPSWGKAVVTKKENLDAIKKFRELTNLKERGYV